MKPMKIAHHELDMRSLGMWIAAALVAGVISGCGGGEGTGMEAAQAASNAAGSGATMMSAPRRDAQSSLPAAGIATSYTAVIIDPSATEFSDRPSLNESGHVAFNSFGQARFYDGETVRSLGTLGGTDSSASALNDSDQVTGFSTTAAGAQRAFLWAPTAGMLDLGAPAGRESRGQGLNSAGHVSGMIVGGAAVSPSLAFLWTPETGMRDLGTQPGIGFQTASLINASEAIVGEAITPSSVDASQAYFWTAADGVQVLGSLQGRSSFAHDLNDANQVVGSAEVVQPVRALHAFLWTAPAGMVDLGTLGGDNSDAAAINQVGQIVGAMQLPSGASHAFLWSTGAAAPHAQDLGTLGGDGSAARDINDLGQIVGSAQTGSGSQHAFIWTATDGMVDLNTRVAAAPAGLELRDALEISNSGFVLVQSNQGLVLLRPAGGEGSVTGTVRFHSPQGALASKAAPDGTAIFRSVVRNTSDSQPQGHTDLILNGLLAFNATAYDLLQVEGGRAQYQGRGTLNGSAGYLFRITETDSGEPGGRGDAVQIRIWHVDPATQAQVVDYDTGATAVVVDRGNIVVHDQ